MPEPLAICAPPGTVRMSAGHFRAWLERAPHGAELEYHRGLLTIDRSPISELEAAERRQLARLADAVLEAAEAGHVLLVQRRHGDFDFGYLAIKRGNPQVAPPVVQPIALPLAA